MISLYDRPIGEGEQEWRADVEKAYADAVHGFIEKHPEFAPVKDTILQQAIELGMDPEDITVEAIENSLAELTNRDTFTDDDLYRLSPSDLKKLNKHPNDYRPLRINDCPRVFLLKKS